MISRKRLITREEAFEIICCLWIKLYRDYDVQQSCVGGCTKGSQRRGKRAVISDARRNRGVRLCTLPSVRFSPPQKRNFLKRALEVVGHVQKGIPFFFNDDVLIPSLVSKGISLEDARDYTQIGCVETVIPGKSNPHAVSGETNLFKSHRICICQWEKHGQPGILSGFANRKTGII
jgi:formate C-acetyltransferase